MFLFQIFLQDMASSLSAQREVNGHPPSHNDSAHNQTTWTGKKATKTRSSPRPASTGVNGTGKGSANSASHRSHDSNATSTNVVSPPPPHPIKPQSWSETNMESPVINRLRIREKLRPVSAAMAGKLRQQRERRRTKRRGPYMPSTEGTVRHRVLFSHFLSSFVLHQVMRVAISEYGRRGRRAISNGQCCQF